MTAPTEERTATKSRDDWETPQHVFAALDLEFGFSIDGAANAENSKCVQWLGPGSAIAESAFDFVAFGDTIFVNPPYKKLQPWVELFAKWKSSGATVVALLLANTDTPWFKHVWEHADEVRFVRGRIQFIDPEGLDRDNNNRGSMVVVYRGHSPVTDSPRVSLVEFPKD